MIYDGDFEVGLMKSVHEIRDPIHVFVKLTADERRVLDSLPLQRLRHIHQLALTYLVYPGATHKRFEHSIGVMELATRIYDTITNRLNLHPDISDAFSELQSQASLQYWRRVLRIASLCHDIGHLPFSHAAEKDLLPDCWDHERLTRELIDSDEMRSIWESFDLPIRVEDIIKLAIGPKKAPDLMFSSWEVLMSEIIVSDFVGADRMDYLMRDSYHTGVAYGRFDYHRVIDTIRILPVTSEEESEKRDSSQRFVLGAEEGGLHAIESLLLARYAMYSQVYLHPIRRIFDLHLIDFLNEWLPSGVFPTDPTKHLRITDNEINVAISRAANDPNDMMCVLAKRIFNRKHFRLLYSRNPLDLKITPNPGQAIYEALSAEFGSDYFRVDRFRQKDSPVSFPIIMRDGRLVSARGSSEILQGIPLAAVDYVFADASILEKAKRWVDQRQAEILEKVRDEPIDG